MKTIEKIDKMVGQVDELKKLKPIAPTKFKWAQTRAKDIQSWLDDLKTELTNNNVNGVLASLSTMKSLIDTIERGLGIHGVK